MPLCWMQGNTRKRSKMKRSGLMASISAWIWSFRAMSLLHVCSKKVGFDIRSTFSSGLFGPRMPVLRMAEAICLMGFSAFEDSVHFWSFSLLSSSLKITSRQPNLAACPLKVAARKKVTWWPRWTSAWARPKQADRWPAASRDWKKIFSGFAAAYVVGALSEVDTDIFRFWHKIKMIKNKNYLTLLAIIGMNNGLYLWQKWDYLR